LQIGAHTDTLWDKGPKPISINDPDDRWTRVPEITRRFPLNQEQLEVASEFGGLVYIVPEDPSLGTVDVTVANAIEAPYHRLYETTSTDWQNRIANPGAPWAEIDSNNASFVVESRIAKTLSEPGWIELYWDATLNAQDELAEWPPGTRKRPERVVFDRQLAYGYMHAGYPVVAPIGRTPTTDDVVRENMDVNSFNTNPQALWGLFHEFGHSHQNPDWTFEGTGEVTVNLFTMYAVEEVTPFPKEDGIWDVSCAGKHKHLCDYFQPEVTQPEVEPGIVPGTFEHWKRDAFLALQMYIPLIDAFGWQPFKTVFKDYLDNPLPPTATDDVKRSRWLFALAVITNRNLGPYFETWHVPTSSDIRQAIRTLPPFDWQPPTAAECEQQPPPHCQ
jgi:hypothetical protein